MRAPRVLACLLLVLAVGGCATTSEKQTVSAALVEVASSEYQWTGVTVLPDGRVVVCFPRWQEDHYLSVAVLTEGGGLAAYPDESWNGLEGMRGPGESFVCVQSVYTDPSGTLWVLDPASPQFAGVVEGGAKLLRIDPTTDRVERVYRFDAPAIEAASYLNDVRVDPARQVAYITDSGVGGLVVLDLATGDARRVLQNHPSTLATDTVPVIGGQAWRRPDGSVPQVHADGLALSPDGETLFYQALTARTLYRVPTAALRDPETTADELASQVEAVAESGINDGLIYGEPGAVYLSSLELDAVRRWEPGHGVRTVVRDPRIRWPDSFAWGPNGWLYFTTSQIHRAPDPGVPYKVFRVYPER